MYARIGDVLGGDRKRLFAALAQAISVLSCSSQPPPPDPCDSSPTACCHLGLEFGCNTCLNPPAEPPGGSLDDVLDLDEAAAASGLAGPVIERAAQLGHVKHRKTASGVLLFTRADVLAFAATH